MAKREILAGATDQTIDVFVQDSASTVGAGLTGLVFNTASLTAYYRKGATGTPTALTLATQTVGGAHSDGGFVAVDGTNCPGQYRVDLSDTIIATAGMTTLYLRGATNMVPCVTEIEVVSVNKFDAVRMGLTALPNAAAEAAGGLYTRGTGAGQINQPANGRIAVDTTHLGGTSQTGRDIGASVLLSPGTGTGQISLTSGTVTTGALSTGTITAASIAADAITDAKVASDVTIASVTGAVGSVTGNVGGNVTGSVGSVATGGIAAASFAAGAIDAAAIAADAITDAKVAADVTIASVTGAVGSVTGAVGSVTGNVGGNVTGSVGSVATGGIAAGSFAAGAITATVVATGAIDADALATDAVTEIAAGISIPSAATIADAVWDEDATAHQTGGTFGQAIGDPGADTNTIFKAVVTDATGATVGVDVAAVLDDTGTAGVVVASLAAGSITASVIATGAVDADALAADAGTEIGTAVWATTTRVLTAGTNIALAKGTGVTGFTDLSAAQVNTEVDTAIADARLDELLAADSDIDGAAPPTVGSVFHELMSKTAGSFTFDQTTDSNEAIRDNMGTAQTGDTFARLGAPAGASVSADIAAIEAQTDDIGTAGAGLTAVPWNAAWDTEVQSEVQDAIEVNHLDHLLAVTYDPASKPGAADALLNELVESDAGVARYTANALEQAPTGGSAPTVGQIADAVWDEDLTGHTTTDSAGQILGDVATGTPPTVGAIADAVWDEATSGHTTSGTFGEQLKTDVDAILDDTGTAGVIVASLAAGSITAAVIATGAVDADALATDAVTEIQAAVAAGAVASVTGAVGSVTGNVGGNVTGSVGSVLGAVGSVTGAVASVTGNVGGNVTGSVGSVVGAVGSVTGAVGSVGAGGITAASIATGAIDADALAADAIDEILDETIGDGTLTMRQALRVLVAGMAGKLSGAATTTVTIRNTADSANVIVATVDASGNRSAVTVTP